MGLFALCLLAGSGWLYDVFAPGVLTGLVRTALHNGLVAVGCAAWVVLRRQRAASFRVLARLAVGAALLFAIPEVVLAGASGHLSQATEVLVYMLVPVVVVFRVGQESAGFGVGGGAMRGLAPALVGLGGAALILPFELPSSEVGRLWLGGLGASAMAAAVAAVWMHRLLVDEEVPLAEAGGAVFGVTAVLAAVFSGVSGVGPAEITASGMALEAVRLVAIDGPILLLTLWLLRAMKPVAFSSRLLLVPAVTLVEGIVAERPEVGWYGWIGLALTFLAGVVLAFGHSGDAARVCLLKFASRESRVFE